MALVSTQPLTEMSTRSISWGKGGRCVRLTTYHHPVPLSRNLGNLTSWNPLGPPGPVTGLFYLYLYGVFLYGVFLYRVFYMGCFNGVFLYGMFLQAGVRDGIVAAWRLITTPALQWSVSRQRKNTPLAGMIDGYVHDVFMPNSKRLFSRSH